jgi:transcriptional regulator with XRE-family HTH domain
VIRSRDDREELGAKVRSRRKALELSIEGLAKRAGLSANYLGAIERGAVHVTLVTGFSLARALEVSPADLMPLVHEPPREPVGPVRQPRGWPPPSGALALREPARFEVPFYGLDPHLEIMTLLLRRHG